jgi:hypothetical protein
MFPLGGDTALESIAGSQTILFTQYVKVILPLDGFVFWVKADLLSQSALSGAMACNQAPYNASLKTQKAAKTFLAKGSLHIALSDRQEETETYDIHRIVFTSESPINDDLAHVDPAHIYIGEFRGQRFAFSQRDNFYERAGLWHYSGDAIYPHMETQIIDNPGQLLDTKSLIASNSLPFWLGLNNNAPFYGFGNTIPLYPSYLVQPDIEPPFATVHIFPESTQAIASAPLIGFREQHSQLMKERVRVVMYGVANDTAMTFVDAVNQYSADYNFFGIMGTPPAMRDEKMQQKELNIIAQKKSIEYDISYYQNSVRDIARQIIGQAIPTFITVSPSFVPLAN